MVINALAQNNSSATPTQEDLMGWAEGHGLDIPVLADENWELESRFAQDSGIPSWTLLGPGAEVLATDDWGAEGMIPDALPDVYPPQ